jgi:adenine-specific DNA-methyltransferase
LLGSVSASIVCQVAERQSAIQRAMRTAFGETFYSAPGFLLYRGDCHDFLKALAGIGQRVDLIVTSPPYNIGKEYEAALPVDQYVEWCRSWLTAVWDVTACNGAFWLNLGYLEVPGRGLCVPIPYLLWNASPFYLVQEIVWNYGAGVSSKRRLSPRNEKWLFYVRDRSEYTFNLDEIRDPNVKYPDQKRNGRFRCNPLGKNPTDVWSFPKVTTGEKRKSRERTIHPAQFPLAVVERIVRVSSNPSDIVIDPFSGSGSTGIAAASLGRLYVGCEISRRYCTLAAERFEAFQRLRQEHQRQAKLF